MVKVAAKIKTGTSTIANRQIRSDCRFEELIKSQTALPFIRPVDIYPVLLLLNKSYIICSAVISRWIGSRIANGNGPAYIQIGG